MNDTVGRITDLIGVSSPGPSFRWREGGIIHEIPTSPVGVGGGGEQVISAGSPLLKDTNPKDAVGIAKVPLSTVSAPVMAEVGLAMLEGARKYGRHNYRVAGVRGSVYYDAAQRHLMAWWEGQDIDPASGLSHITKAIATLVVLRDAMMNDKLVDDRPPAAANQNWVEDFNLKAALIIEMYPDAKAPFTAK